MFGSKYQVIFILKKSLLPVHGWLMPTTSVSTVCVLGHCCSGLQRPASAAWGGLLAAICWYYVSSRFKAYCLCHRHRMAATWYSCLVTCQNAQIIFYIVFKFYILHTTDTENINKIFFGFRNNVVFLIWNVNVLNSSDTYCIIFPVMNCNSNNWFVSSFLILFLS